MVIQRSLRHVIRAASILLLLVGCVSPAGGPGPASPTVGVTTVASPPAATLTAVPAEKADEEGLSAEEVATLGSLEKVDDYPLYTMHYHGAYWAAAPAGEGVGWLADATSPACSLFVALGDPDHMLYGRNFDWRYSPAVLLFTDPPDGYASVSMVDITYLGFGGAKAGTLTDLPLVERSALLRAPSLPFDGMNEHGLAVGMAAVPESDMPREPGRDNIGSLGIIREMLDHARDVDEAVSLLQSYNIQWTGGPALHYLVADASGRAVLVEFYQGEMIVMPNEAPWHLATNFLRTVAGETAKGRCWRYDMIFGRLTGAEGRIIARDAMALLEGVSQEGTQWSVIYRMSTGEVNVSMGRQYGNVHTFHLSLAGE